MNRKINLVIGLCNIAAATLMGLIYSQLSIPVDRIGAAATICNSLFGFWNIYLWVKVSELHKSTTGEQDG